MSELKALLTLQKVDFSNVTFRKDFISLCQTHKIRATLLQDLPEYARQLIQETGRGRLRSTQIRHRREEDTEGDCDADTPLVIPFRSGVTTETVHVWPFTGIRMESIRHSLMQNPKYKMKFVSCDFPPPDSGEVLTETTQSDVGTFCLTLRDFQEQYMHIGTRRLPHGE